MGLREHLVPLAVVRASQRRTYFTSEQFYEFVNDARINFIPTESLLASNIAHAHRTKQGRESRLAPTMPKDGYSGKIPVDRRIRNGLVTHIPVYNPELGDDLALYIRVLRRTCDYVIILRAAQCDYCHN